MIVQATSAEQHTEIQPDVLGAVIAVTLLQLCDAYMGVF